MNKKEITQWLQARRLEAENEKRRATESENIPAFSLAFGRVREIDEFLLMLQTNILSED